MKQVGLLAVLVLLVIAGGGLTSQLGGVPVIIQTDVPDASVFVATPQQANLIIFWVGFVVFNLVGAGLTIAVLMWLGSREVARAKAMPNRLIESENEEKSLTPTSESA